MRPGELPGERGVVVGHQTRLGLVGQSKPFEAPNTKGILPNPIYEAGDLIGYDQPDKVQCIVLLRKNEDSLPALRDVEDKVEELNDPGSGRMLPGVRSSRITTAPT